MLYKKSSIWHESHVIANNRGYCAISTNHIQCDNVAFAKKSFSKTRSTKKKDSVCYFLVTSVSSVEKESNYVSFEKPLGQLLWQPVSSPTHTWLISTHFHPATENAPHSAAPASVWCNYTRAPPHTYLLHLRSTQALITTCFKSQRLDIVQWLSIKIK